MKIYVIALIGLILISCKAPQEVTDTSKININHAESQVQPWHSAKIDSLEKTIYDVAHALKIPFKIPTNKYSQNINQNIVRFIDKKSSNPKKVFLRFKLNKQIVDFNYANIILKQELEKVGATMVSGKFFAHWNGYTTGQELRFRNRDNSFEYLIRLVYDNAPYTANDTKRKISFVVTQLGNTFDIVNDNIDYFKENKFTFAFEGQANYTDTLSNLAESLEIESMLTIPIESYPIRRDRISRAGAIKVTNPIDPEKIAGAINSLNLNTRDIKGITHYWGNFGTSESELMTEIIAYCKRMNFYYVDAWTTSDSEAYRIASRHQIPTSWALSYKQVTKNNFTSYIKKNSKPIIMLTLKDQQDLDKIKLFVDLIDRHNLSIVYVSDLLKTDLLKIE
ncbi:MAG: hypothetical protein B6226_05795 [Candidatus Cloacimonetes bacterium 4572_65]|nr:MAG: hypothetical protein B6226_05795 [Candidatus Cloacimonetes bacterium 4572_65]